MKKRIPSFLMGVVATVMVLTLSLTALAATGAITIEVAPIDVLVDGKVFQPKDANGNDVMVFVHNGTTYAPLRALAEAYGLEVGYDGEKRVATVSQPGQSPTPTNPVGETTTAPAANNTIPKSVSINGTEVEVVAQNGLGYISIVSLRDIWSGQGLKYYVYYNEETSRIDLVFIKGELGVLTPNWHDDPALYDIIISLDSNASYMLIIDGSAYIELSYYLNSLDTKLFN